MGIKEDNEWALRRSIILVRNIPREIYFNMLNFNIAICDNRSCKRISS